MQMTFFNKLEFLIENLGIRCYKSYLNRNKTKYKIDMTL